MKIKFIITNIIIIEWLLWIYAIYVATLLQNSVYSVLSRYVKSTFENRPCVKYVHQGETDCSSPDTDFITLEPFNVAFINTPDILEIIVKHGKSFQAKTPGDNIVLYPNRPEYLRPEES